MKPLLHIGFALFDVLDGQRGRLFLWGPVLLACGIGLYFSMPLEPDRKLFLPLLLGCCAALALLARLPAYFRPPLVAIVLMIIGFLIAGVRAHSVAEPVLTYRYYGPVEGRVVKIDRSASEALRLTLDHVRLKNMPPERTPERVRISLHGEQPFVTPEPGQRLMMTGHLSPPPGPSEPGGFDFQRMAWFDRLGAVGYTRVPILKAAQSENSLQLRLARLRQALSNGLQSRIEGQAGAFAAAILTGDRSGITAQTSESLRASNLSHLLAISGLHMGLLTGVVFAAFRYAMALVPPLVLTYPTKKIAALAAMIFGLFYLAMSGWSVSTERAYIMVSVMFLAILLDRQAISLRAVALAALLILTLRPEVLTEPGFQMSFAATTALVAVFTMLRRLGLMQRWPPALRFVATVIISSAVAGIATAPVAAAHFNRIADFGLIANVLAVPVMGAIVMPSAVLSLVLAPLGLEGVGFWFMEKGIQWILMIANWVAGWDGAVSRIPAPASATLPLIALGGLFVILWRGRAQNLGVLPVLLGFVLWGLNERPALLVSNDGGLIGLMGAEGRALNKPKGSSFAAHSWLENDGDLPDQAAAAERILGDMRLSGLMIAHVSGRGWQDRAYEACGAANIVIVNKKMEEYSNTPCKFFDLSKLRQTGSLAFYPNDTGVEIKTAYGEAGVRLWNTPQLWRRTKERAQSAKEISQQMQQDVLGLFLQPNRGARFVQATPQ